MTQPGKRSVGIASWIQELLQDVKYGARRLRRAPLFSATVILTLALGIGACVAVFSIVDSILIHPYAGAVDPDRQVFISETHLPRVTDSALSPPAFLDLEAEARSFDAVAAARVLTFSVTGEGDPWPLIGARVTNRYFDIMGVTMALGRPFRPYEDEPGRNAVAIISHGAWQALFGGDPKIIGHSVLLNGVPNTIVGVTSPDYARLDLPMNVFVPMSFTDTERSQRTNRLFRTVGRLKRGVSVQDAKSELAVISSRLEQELPDTNAGWGFTLGNEARHRGRGLQVTLWTLFASVVGVLLIACANVANLLLSRATGRRQEMAVRVALGAGRMRLVRQLLTESVLLALVSGALGVLVAHWALGLAHGFAGDEGLGRLAFVAIDTRLLLFALGASVLTGVLFGMAPAWIGAGGDVGENIKAAGRQGMGGRGAGWIRNGLIVLEVAGTMSLLVCAGLLLRSLAKQTQGDPGYRTDRITAVQMRLSQVKYNSYTLRNTLLDGVLANLSKMPGVDLAAVVNAPPPTNVVRLGVVIEGRPPPPQTDWPSATQFGVSAGYFKLMGIRLLKGRFFDPRDNTGQPRVVVISESFAVRYFPDEDPLGKRVRIPGLVADDSVWEIVGVANNVGTSLEGSGAPQIYIPLGHRPTPTVSFLLRSQGTAPPPAALIKQQVHAVDPSQPIQSVQPLAAVREGGVRNQRFTLRLVGLFSIVALAIAAVGINGVVDGYVSQRRNEIGLRMALGARPRDVLLLVVGHGASLVAIGLLLGGVFSVWAGNLIQSLLYDMSARDPLILGGVGAFLAVLALCAWIPPVLRAMRIDPMVAFRSE